MNKVTVAARDCHLVHIIRDGFMDDVLRRLLDEKQEFQFIKFNESIAWQIGVQLVDEQRMKICLIVESTRTFLEKEQ
jgi:hypothetical protein